MLIEVNRLRDNNDSTIGTLKVDGVFQCFTLEDTHNTPKIYGETCIPEGEYRITLRNEGGMVQRYNKKYDFHKGMLWLRGVPNFEYVYIHVGNVEDDTDGCLLVGKTCSSMTGDQRVSGSQFAYIDLYPKIANAIESGDNVTIKIRS